MDSPLVSRLRPSLKRANTGRWIPGILILALALYGILSLRFAGGYAGGSDSSGYLNNAKLLQSGRLKVKQREVPGVDPVTLPPQALVPLGFIPVGSREMVPTYPMGLSILIVAVSSVTSMEVAPSITLWLHGIAGVVLIFFFARKLGLSHATAGVGALLLGFCPLYLFMTVQVMSDVPALVWCMLAVYAACSSRENVRWGVIAGMAVAVGVLIRPTNLLIIFPVALAVGPSWRRWVALSIGAAPGAGYLIWFNHVVYGKFLTTGYGDVGSLFGWKNVVPSLTMYAHWLPVFLTPGLILILGAPWFARKPRAPLNLVLAVWALIFVGFYSAYFHTHETWRNLRFISPAIPPLILLILSGGATLAPRWPTLVRGWSTAMIALSILAWSFVWNDKLRILSDDFSLDEKMYREAASWAKSHLPNDAVIVGMQVTGAFYYYTDFTLVRWDQRGSHILSIIAASRKPIYAALLPFETEEALINELPGNWNQIGAINQIVFWKFEGAKPVTKPTPPWRRVLWSANFDGKSATLQTGSGWFDIEQDSKRVWCWSQGHGDVVVDFGSHRGTHARLQFQTRGISPRRLVVSQRGKILWEGSVAKNLENAVFDFELTEGKAQLEFDSDSPAVPEDTNSDSRHLSFAIFDPTVALLPN